ncbi:immunoglobulin-like domain-containing protein [Listeria costaricensis]|uniref:immunoglobulin-like domain-containing protein n=1 Tax=Listeria costaricensis TaxID=2026604 RepID=UPI0013C4AE84|nr:immunoglobulin-like domain-containing protein [Listeria costaricensis]
MNMLKFAGLAITSGGILLFAGQDGGSHIVRAEETTPIKIVSAENGSFEDPMLEQASFAYGVHPDLLKWHTTDQSGRVEVMNNYEGQTAADGNQWVELAGTEASSIYQDIETTPGTRIRWSVQHRGRTGVDTAEVQFGAPNGQMQTQKTMSDGPTWTKYYGSYMVPEGQTVTRFAFKAISSSDGGLDYGNWLDDVVFATQSKLNVTGSFSNAALAKNQETTYDLEVVNEGGLDTGNNIVTINLPQEVSYIADTLRTNGATVANESSSEHQISFYLGGLAVGEKATVSVDVRGDQFATDVEASATISYNDKGYSNENYQTSSNKSLMTIGEGEAPAITADASYELAQFAAVPDAATFKEAVHTSASDKEDGAIQMEDIEVTGLEQIDTDAPGNYQVTLKVTDSSGNTSEYQVEVMVKEVAAEAGDNMEDEEGLVVDHQINEENLASNDLNVTSLDSNSDKGLLVTGQEAKLNKQATVETSLPKTGDSPSGFAGRLLGTILVLGSLFWFKKDKTSKNNR